MILLWLIISGLGIYDPPIVVISGRAQGTSYSIKYIGNISDIKKAEIDSLFSGIDHSLSLYDTNSLISQFNKKGSVKMDTYMSDVIQASIQVNKESSGGFDI